MRLTKDSNLDEVREPFLDKGLSADSDNGTAHNTTPSKPHQYRPLLSPRHILFHIVLVAMYTLLSAITIYAILRDPTLASAAKYKAPGWLSEARLQPVPTIFHNYLTEASPYTSLASNSTVSDAWQTLLSSSNMRATDDELRLSGARSSMRLSQSADGDNLVWLGVFQELQCLRCLREYIHDSTCHSREVAQGLQSSALQADTCIEVLRQRVLCMPDLDLVAFVQENGEHRVVPQHRARVRECVNWDKLMESLQSRVVTEEELGKVGFPVMGNAS